MTPIRPTLPQTNIAPESGWLEYDHFLLEPGLFSGAQTPLVLGSVYTTLSSNPGSSLQEVLANAALNAIVRG